MSGESKLLTKGDILNAKDVIVERVEIHERGGHVFVRVISGAERDAFEQEHFRAKSGVPQDFRSRWAQMAICDEHGVALFSSQDVKELGKKSSKALQRVVSAAMALNNATIEAVEETEKNFESGPNDGSGSS